MSPKTDRLVISRDVIFDEMKTWSWETNGSEVSTVLEEKAIVPIIEEASTYSSYSRSKSCKLKVSITQENVLPQRDV